MSDCRENSLFQVFKLSEKYFICPISNLKSISDLIKETLNDKIEFLNNQFISCFGSLPNFNFNNIDDVEDFIQFVKESNSLKIIDLKLITQVDSNFVLFYDMPIPDKCVEINFNLFDEKLLEEAEYCYKFKYTNENKHFDYH